MIKKHTFGRGGYREALGKCTPFGHIMVLWSWMVTLSKILNSAPYNKLSTHERKFMDSFRVVLYNNHRRKKLFHSFSSFPTDWQEAGTGVERAYIVLKLLLVSRAGACSIFR